MPLPPGTRLGHYDIVALIGAGGMGEVYRARDTKLSRDVAIKILAELFAADADRLARFEREAHVLASLNHPHIAQIHGVVDSPPALVMELVDGEDLAQRLTRGLMPLDDSLAIARQIAEALEAAHEQGIVHRDLKPANVKVTPDGRVKVLDFGLAKAMASGPDGLRAADASELGPGPASLANSPTITSPRRMTQVGVILGTAAYMAPEQARGRPVDRRADIWAFGCLVYEMLAGAPPFGGETVTDVLSAIVSRDPEWSRLPAATPSVVRLLLRRCLEKDPKERLRDIGEARIVLEHPLDAAVATPAAASRAGWLVPSLGALVALLAIALVWLLTRGAGDHHAADGRAVTRYDVQLPGNASVSIVFRPAVSVSADGSTFAFVGAADGVNRIYVRSRSEVAPHAIAGTEGGESPALSPDGRWVAFYANGSVRKAGIDGGVVTLGPARDVRGIAWADPSTLILTADASAPLSRMPASGGDIQPITTLAAGERTHRWPDVVGGGKAVLFTVGTLDKPDTYDQGNIDAVTLATGERRVVIKGAAMARSCGAGRLVFSKGSALYAVPFDPERVEVTGPPVEVVQSVERDTSTGAAHFDCGEEGTLAFVPGSPAGDLRRLTWRDREGHEQPVALADGPYQEIRVSPDGSRVALLNGSSGAGDVWIYDFGQGTFSRLTFNGANAAPMWNADGRVVYYTTIDRSGTKSTITRKLADGSREAETLRTVDGRAYLGYVDEGHGIAIVDATTTANDRGDVMRVMLATSAAPEPLVSSQFNEFAGTVSPGGRWLAYQSDDSGRPEVYVRDLSGSGVRRQVTASGGAEPHWSRDGRELFYRLENRLMAAPITLEPSFQAGNARPLFDGVYNSGIESGRSYDVDPKTGRFLLVVPARESRVTGTVRIILNWDAR